jgi:hypothetical protein
MLSNVYSLPYLPLDNLPAQYFRINGSVIAEMGLITDGSGVLTSTWESVEGVQTTGVFVLIFDGFL